MSELLFFENKDHIIKKIREINSDSLLLVVDTKVNDLYGDFIRDLTHLSEKKVLLWVAPEGEECKKFCYLEEALEFFLERGAHRKSHLIAIGGGATSDFAGMISSLLLRGIEWSIIPTTLLSMVDASIGGKTAVNSRFGKNLIGAFNLPNFILMDFSFLKTLEESQVQSGKGEILKYAFLSGEISRILAERKFDLENIIKICSKFKSDLVKRDLKESGERKILNYGHTVGHAIEKQYGLEHGIAVTFGILVIAKMFKDEEIVSQVTSFCKKMNLEGSLKVNEDEENLFEYISKDKKIKDRGKIDIIRVKKIGVPFIEEISLENFKERFFSTWRDLDELRL